MSRNRYTRRVRADENRRHARQEKELARFAGVLRRVGAGSTVDVFVDETKQRRRSRRVNNRSHKPVAAAVLAVLAAALTACGAATSPRGALGENQKILASCDRAAPPASDIEIDGSGSSASDQITAARMAVVASIVRSTVVCSGRLRVSVFSSSSAGTTTLFDGPLQLEGATTNARLRRVPRVVNAVMAQIRAAYGPAVARLDAHGSDITAQYRLAGEWIAQLGGKPRLRLHLYLLTDGFETVGVNLNKALSKNAAVALADRVPVPRLPGASVVVAGLGRVAGKPPRSRVVEGLVAYYDALCHKTTATTCVSVTDYTPAGR